MVVGDLPQAADLLVIGAGPGGYTAALAAARAGREVVLIDRYGSQGAGGVCLREGCIPSKALIHLADAAHDTKARADIGLQVLGDQRINLAAFQRWKNDVIKTLGDGVRSSLHTAGVTIVAGRATFTGPRSVRVESPDGPPASYEFTDAVIATGSSPTPVPALDPADSRVLDAAGVLELDHLPSHVVVVGAGYIGIELGTALVKLGVHVSVVEVATEILPGLDPQAAREVRRRLKELGATVHTGAEVLALDDGGLEIAAGCRRQHLQAQYVLVATGRRPNTDLGLHHAGITCTSGGHIQVDADLRATPHIAAVGDVIPGPGLAHKASAEARIAIAALCGEKVTLDHAVPLVVFSDPEIAVVGSSAEQASQTYGEVGTAWLPITKIGRGFLEQRTHGFVRLIYEPRDRRLLGAVLCGPHVTELVAEVTLAIEAGLTVDDLALTIHPHPTISEAVWEAALATDPDPVRHDDHREDIMETYSEHIAAPRSPQLSARPDQSPPKSVS